MSDPLLTHKALATLLGVSETTVKSYRRKFPGCIPVASEGKPIRFTAEATAVALRIRDLFTSGMSVKEVRQRLSGEFSWISPDAPKTAGHSTTEKTTPELSLGVSNMAKSMVAMAQQQSVINKRMQAIEEMLSELGLKGTDVESLRTAGAEAARQKDGHLAARLEHLDNVTQGLADAVGRLAGDLGCFLGNRSKAAEEWRDNGGIASIENAEQASLASPQRTQPSAQIIPLRAKPAEHNSAAYTHSAEPSGESRSTEPPRHLFSLPLVVRTAQGQCISADGRIRSRFCVNDLKAMLIYGFTPPAHYVLRWEPHGEAWWLVLTQPQQENSRTLQLLLMEVAGRPEGNILELLQLQENGQSVHPTAFTRVLESING